MRRFSAVAILLLISISACSDRQDVTIRIIGEAYAPLEALDRTKDEYEREMGVQIIVEQYDFESAVEKVMLDLSSGTGRYDIILQPHLSLGRLAESDLLEPIHEYKTDSSLHNPEFNPEEDVYQKFWRELSWYNEIVYGYPFTANTMYLWYRKDLLEDEASKRDFNEQYGYDLDVPATWDQYYDVAEFFTDRNREFYGTTLQGKRHPALWYEWLNFAYSFGGGVMSKEHAWEYGPIVINCPETVEATEFYKSLMEFSPPGVLEYTWDEALASMQQGNVFMAIMWSDATYLVEDSTESRVHGRMGYAMIPEGRIGRVGQIAGWSYLISKYSKHKEEAYRFIEWMMLPENQIKQQLLGGASAVKATYEDPRVKRIPYTEAYTNTLEVARTMSSSVPETNQASDIIQVCLSNILSDVVTVEEGLNSCALQLEELFEDRAELACPVQ